MAFARDHWYVVALAEEMGERPLARAVCGDPHVPVIPDRNRLPPAAGQG